MAAKDAAFHLEVADGGTVEPNERGTVVIDVFETVGHGPATVVGQRVHASAEGAAEGFVTFTNADALGIDVGRHFEILAVVAVAAADVVGQLPPVCGVIYKVRVGAGSATVPGPCPLHNCAQQGEN